MAVYGSDDERSASQTWPSMTSVNPEPAIATGVAPDRVVLAEDGVVIDLKDGVAKVVGAVPCGYVYVDGSSVGEITDADLKDRRILGEEGFISVIVVVDSVSGKVAGGPEIHARGFAEGGDDVFDEIKQPIIDALDAAIADGTSDAYQLQQTVRRVVGRWVSNRHRRRPTPCRHRLQRGWQSRGCARSRCWRCGH